MWGFNMVRIGLCKEARLLLENIDINKLNIQFTSTCKEIFDMLAEQKITGIVIAHENKKLCFNSNSIVHTADSNVVTIAKKKKNGKIWVNRHFDIEDRKIFVEDYQDGYKEELNQLVKKYKIIM